MPRSDSDPNTTYLWLDIFATIQERGEAAKIQDIEGVQKAVVGSKYGTLVILDSSASQLNRTWIWFEVWATLKSKGFEEIHWLTPGFNMRDQLSGPFCVADVRQSLCHFTSDRSKLIELMSGADGRGLRDINAQIKLQYVLNPKDNRQASLRVMASPSWRFGAMVQRNLSKWAERYSNWLGLTPSHPNYRCLWISGPSGSGKTSLAAGICE